MFGRSVARKARGWRPWILGEGNIVVNERALTTPMESACDAPADSIDTSPVKELDQSSKRRTI
eukprot:scaffold166295_cov32-Tisochrysis_lutea.AAC.3